jgi:hypothetical protein
MSGRRPEFGFGAIRRAIELWPEGSDPGAASDDPGVYAIFLEKTGGLDGLAMGGPPLLYIGKAAGNLTGC